MSDQSQGYGGPAQHHPQDGRPQYGQPQYDGPQPGPGYYAPQAIERPKSMDTAVLLMRIGAALAVINALATFLLKGQIRDATEKSLRDSGQTFGPSQIDALVNVSLGMAVFSGVVGACLWLWMAAANKAGKSWARIVSSVFFAISVMSLIFALTKPSGGPIALVLSVLPVLVGAAALFFMWKPESSRFYELSSRTI